MNAESPGKGQHFGIRSFLVSVCGSGLGCMQLNSPSEEEKHWLKCDIRNHRLPSDNNYFIFHPSIHCQPLIQPWRRPTPTWNKSDLLPSTGTQLSLWEYRDWMALRRDPPHPILKSWSIVPWPGWNPHCSSSIWGSRIGRTVQHLGVDFPRQAE